MGIEFRRIFSYNEYMRRRHGLLIPSEAAVLEAGVALEQQGRRHFHGFLLSKTIRDLQGSPIFPSVGGLYKALDRLERAGFLESEWEDFEAAAHESRAQRPRRRLYHTTDSGIQALDAFHAQQQVIAARWSREAVTA